MGRANPSGGPRLFAIIRGPPKASRRWRDRFAGDRGQRPEAGGQRTGDRGGGQYPISNIQSPTSTIQCSSGKKEAGGRRQGADEEEATDNADFAEGFPGSTINQEPQPSTPPSGGEQPPTTKNFHQPSSAARQWGGGGAHCRHEFGVARHGLFPFVRGLRCTHDRRGRVSVLGLPDADSVGSGAVLRTLWRSGAGRHHRCVRVRLVSKNNPRL